MERIKNKRKKVFLSFRLGKETFAVSVKKVLEVLQQQQITEIPDVPVYIKGVINFRGDILPICDTRIKFNLPEHTINEKSVIIILDLENNNQKVRIGAIADSVKDVISIEDTDMMPVPEMGFNYNAHYLQGMIKNGKTFIMVLNVDKVFTSDEVSILKTSVENSENK